MYNAQELKQRIKNQAKIKNVLISDMLVECGLSINTVSQISDKKGISCFSLARIADCLECSVDYLLGRSDVVNSAAFDEVITLFDKLPESEKNKVIGRMEHMLENAETEINDDRVSALYRYSGIAAEGGTINKAAKRKNSTTL